ncbi:hypothetical protein GOV07_01850 [Candidatus Woesearchaeota archaeon]|nr:hypothetical protein [Candidatus Woesearchaeota archaeon]
MNNYQKLRTGLRDVLGDKDLMLAIKAGAAALALGTLFAIAYHSQTGRSQKPLPPISTATPAQYVAPPPTPTPIPFLIGEKRIESLDDLEAVSLGTLATHSIESMGYNF